MSDRIRRHLERLRDYEMSPEEVAEQRVGFAYGNAPLFDSNMTREQTKEAIETTKAPLTKA